MLIRRLPPVTEEEAADYDRRYRERLRSLEGVDDAVDNLMTTLAETGQLENTHVIFTSDNGFHVGEHRLGHGKITPYEEDTHVPLLWRGPGVAQGERSEFVLTNDLAPTIADLAGVPAPEAADGCSLRPLLTAVPGGEIPWRNAFMVEWHKPDKFPALYHALRTENRLYVEHDTGERELYNFPRDPYQLENAYAEAEPALVEDLSARLEALKGYTGDACRKAERGVKTSGGALR